MEPQAPEPPAPAALRVLHAIGYMLLFLLVQVVAGVVLVSLGFAPGELTSGNVQTRDVLRICLLEIIVLAGAMLFIARRGGIRGLDLELRGPRQARGWLQLAPAGLLVIGPSFALALSEGVDTLVTDMTSATMLAFLALAVLIAVAEELWFRGLVMAALEPSRSPWLAVLGSALIFGLPHVFSSSSGVTAATALNAAAVTLAVAVPFACVRTVSRGIVPAIGWHSAIDAWAFLHTSSITAEGTPDIGEASAALVIPTLIAIGYLVWLARRIDGRTHSTL